LTARFDELLTHQIEQIVFLYLNQVESFFTSAFHLTPKENPSAVKKGGMI